MLLFPITGSFDTIAMLPTVRFDTRTQDDSEDFAYHRILATGAGDEEADSDVEDIEDPRAGKSFLL